VCQQLVVLLIGDRSRLEQRGPRPLARVPKERAAFRTEHFPDPVHLTELVADLMGKHVAAAIVAEGLIERDHQVRAS